MPCNKIISDQAIQYTYKYKGVILHADVRAHPCSGENEKKVDINIFASEEPHDQLNHQPIQRTYYAQKELRGKKGLIGKVAFHNYFILKKQYRAQGIMTKVHSKELETYKQLEFQEIQLDAAWDGLIVWKKMNYIFDGPTEASKAIVPLQIYLKTERKLSTNQINDIIKNDPFSINLQYLRAETNIMSFMDWAERNKIGCVRMYKEVKSS